MIICTLGGRLALKLAPLQVVPAVHVEPARNRAERTATNGRTLLVHQYHIQGFREFRQATRPANNGLPCGTSSIVY